MKSGNRSIFTSQERELSIEFENAPNTLAWRRVEPKVDVALAHFRERMGNAAPPFATASRCALVEGVGHGVSLP